MGQAAENRGEGRPSPGDEPPFTHEDGALFLSLGLVGRSSAFRSALHLARRFAASAAPVLIRGRTGNGKELFARAIHYLGERRGGPFVPVNCGALPDALVESELFGHVRGAFTDAKGERDGLVALAGRGTLFLDEVDSLSPKAQVSLLRFLQDHEYRRVGGARIERADVRVLAATNGDLRAAVAEGRFREDLLFRLDVLGLDLPPLAERGEDVALLARHFLTRFAARYAGGAPAPRLDPDAEAWLRAQAWPGNVRQLENLMHRACVLATDGRVRLADLDPGSSASSPCAPCRPAAFPQPGDASRAEGAPAHGATLPEGGLKEARERQARAFERDYLSRLLALTNGNVTQAARRAGTERRALGRMLKRNGIDKDGYRG